MSQSWSRLKNTRKTEKKDVAELADGAQPSRPRTGPKQPDFGSVLFVHTLGPVAPHLNEACLSRDPWHSSSSSFLTSPANSKEEQTNRAEQGSLASSPFSASSSSLLHLWLPRTPRATPFFFLCFFIFPTTLCLPHT